MATVLKLRGVDNVYVLIGLERNFQFSNKKVECLQQLCDFVDDLDWEKGIQVWRSVTGFGEFEKPDVKGGVRHEVDVAWYQQDSKQENREKARGINLINADIGGETQLEVAVIEEEPKHNSEEDKHEDDESCENVSIEVDLNGVAKKVKEEHGNALQNEDEISPVMGSSYEPKVHVNSSPLNEKCKNETIVHESSMNEAAETSDKILSLYHDSAQNTNASSNPNSQPDMNNGNYKLYDEKSAAGGKDYALELVELLVESIIDDGGVDRGEGVKIDILTASTCPEKLCTDGPAKTKNPFFRVTCFRGSSEHPFESPEAAAEFGAAIVSRFGWPVSMKHYDMEVVLTIDGVLHTLETQLTASATKCHACNFNFPIMLELNFPSKTSFDFFNKHPNFLTECVYVGIRLSPRSLHQRNIMEFGPTTLRATICFNMLYLAMVMPGDIVCDPLCGGGSIPLEGTQGFPHAWYIAGDNHEKAYTRTLHNMAALRNEKGLKMDMHCWDATHLPLRDSLVDVFITDLPFGKRMGTRRDNRELYFHVLLEMARCVRPRWGRAIILTLDVTSLSKALGQLGMYWLRPRQYNINIGGLKGVISQLQRTSNVLCTYAEHSNGMLKKFTNENSSVTAKQSAVATSSLAVNSQESVESNASLHVVKALTIGDSEGTSENLSTATTPLQLDPESHEAKTSFTPAVPSFHMPVEKDDPALMIQVDAGKMMEDICKLETLPHEKKLSGPDSSPEMSIAQGKLAAMRPRCCMDATLFNDAFAPNDFEFFVNHKDAFLQMWKDQGQKFWVRLMLAHRSYVLSLLFKDDPESERARKTEKQIQYMFERGYIQLYRHIMEEKSKQPKTFLEHLATLTQNRSLLMNVYKEGSKGVEEESLQWLMKARLCQCEGCVDLPPEDCKCTDCVGPNGQTLRNTEHGDRFNMVYHFPSLLPPQSKSESHSAYFRVCLNKLDAKWKDVDDSKYDCDLPYRIQEEIEEMYEADCIIGQYLENIYEDIQRLKETLLLMQVEGWLHSESPGVVNLYKKATKIFFNQCNTLNEHLHNAQALMLDFNIRVHLLEDYWRNRSASGKKRKGKKKMSLPEDSFPTEDVTADEFLAWTRPLRVLLKEAVKDPIKKEKLIACTKRLAEATCLDLFPDDTLGDRIYEHSFLIKVREALETTCFKDYYRKKIAEDFKANTLKILNGLVPIIAPHLGESSQFQVP
ncbi:unnamed protein product [Darwinula stevensoni]|uniref:Ribosomal RNA large subunit methyltransferase K/L-like methyltransferase domain-containing protein n=1 Tax=Darwinula stevensoni TaxID=69355 RepID=A0A7R8XG13_9CRUS|nr:unnamed protein product [Darwinula stevensoni]CAG0891234.1 unnamed protein product [Darwinula stevensoni]